MLALHLVLLGSVLRLCLLLAAMQLVGLLAATAVAPLLCQQSPDLLQSADAANLYM
jgi:hypothetical protein